MAVLCPDIPNFIKFNGLPSLESAGLTQLGSLVKFVSYRLVVMANSYVNISICNFNGLLAVEKGTSVLGFYAFFFIL